MGKHVIRIKADGTTEFIDVPELAELKSGGAATKRRASHVEPWRRGYRWAFHLLRRVFGEDGRVARFTRRWPIYWRVNLTPSGGPILDYKYANREQAIADEVTWLQENRLGSPAPRPDSPGSASGTSGP